MVSIFLLVIAGGYPEMARTFPRLILLLIVGLTALDIFTKLWMKSEARSPQEKREGTDRKQKVRVIITVALMFAFLFCMLVLGFTVGVLVFLFISAWLLGYRNIKVLLISSILFTGFMYVVFIVIMDSILPVGMIFEMLRE